MSREDLFKIAAKPVNQILLDMVSIKKKLGEAAMPVITLLLHNGKEVKGYLLDINQRNLSFDLLFSIQNPSRNSPETNILYIESTSVAAVIIHNADSLSEYLSSQNIAQILPDASATKLDVKRKISFISEDLSAKMNKNIVYELDWHSVPEDEKKYAQILFFSSELHKTLLGLAEDKIGKEALLEQVEKISLQFDEMMDETKISIENKNLAILSSCKGAKSLKADLRNLIEEAL